jgi:hypothetical protein
MNGSFYCGIEELGVCRSGKTWQCVLCGVVIKSEENRRQHAKAGNHQDNVVKSFEKSSKQYVANLGMRTLRRHTNALDIESGVDRLQSPNWQLHVQGVLYRYMKLADDMFSSEEASLLTQAKTLLQKYEQMERLSLLELAVWKAASISHAGQVELDSKMNMKTVHDAILCAAKHQHTWKKYRTETRKSNAIEIIMKHVLPFLGKP